MLKYETKRIIDLYDWNTLVKDTYGRPYNFQQQDDCQPRGTYPLTVPDNKAQDFENDTIPEVINGSIMGVSFEAWLARDPDLDVFGNKSSNTLFWNRNFYPCIEVVANDLYKKGLIEAGEYSIDIDW